MSNYFADKARDQVQSIMDDAMQPLFKDRLQLYETSKTFIVGLHYFCEQQQNLTGGWDDRYQLWFTSPMLPEQTHTVYAQLEAFSANNAIENFEFIMKHRPEPAPNRSATKTAIMVIKTPHHIGDKGLDLSTVLQMCRKKKVEIVFADNILKQYMTGEISSESAKIIQSELELVHHVAEIPTFPEQLKEQAASAGSFNPSDVMGTFHMEALLKRDSDKTYDYSLVSKQDLGTMTAAEILTVLREKSNNGYENFINLNNFGSPTNLSPSKTRVTWEYFATTNKKLRVQACFEFKEAIANSEKQKQVGQYFLQELKK